MLELIFCTDEELVQEMANRGGYLEALAKAAKVVIKKTDDYNNGANDFNHANRDSYFPFGIKSYAQMIHVKSQRLVSLANEEKTPNFESIEDSLIDLINYAAFYIGGSDNEKLEK